MALTSAESLAVDFVTTRLSDLGLYRLGIESRSLAWKTKALPLSHRGDTYNFEFDMLSIQIKIAKYIINVYTDQNNYSLS